MAETPISHKIFKNTLFISASRFISGLSGFILTPFLLRYLGLTQFGVWSFLFVLIAYLNLLDLGLADATVKFTAQYEAHHNRKAIFNLFTSAVIFYILLLLLLVIIYFISKPLFDRLIPLPQETALVASQLFLAAIAYSSITKVNNVIVSIYGGLQKMELVTLNQVVYTTLTFTLAMIAIVSRQNILVIVWTPFAAQALTLVFQCFFIKSTLTDFYLDLTLVDREFLKRTLFLGSGIQATISAHTLNTQITKSLVATLGFNYLAVYELGFKAVSFLKSLPTVLLAPVFPAISHLNAIDIPRRNRVISQGTKYLGFVTYPVFLLSFVFAPQMLQFWLHQNQPLAVLATRFLLIAFLPDTLIGIITTTLNGVGRVYLHVEYALVILILNSVGLYAVLRLGKFESVLFVLPIVVLISTVWILWRFSRSVLTLNLGFFWHNMIKSGLAGLAASLLALMFFSYLPAFISPFLGAIFSGIFFVPLYMGLLYFAGFFNDEDLRLLCGITAKLKYKLLAS